MKQDKAVVNSVIKSKVLYDRQGPFNGFTVKNVHGRKSDHLSEVLIESQAKYIYTVYVKYMCIWQTWNKWINWFLLIKKKSNYVYN